MAKLKDKTILEMKKWGLSRDVQRLESWTLWKFYGNKFENLYKMNKVLEKVNLPRETQEETENLISTDHQENLISY